jgi:1,4-dihydroxy-2-naphthoate octaprenyltransferase
MLTKIKLYIEELRAPFFTATLVPVFMGTAIAWARTGIFYPGYFVLTLLGATFLHAGANVINDYFDHKRGCDEANKEFVRPFTGGSRMIQKGLLSPREVLTEALLFFALGSLIGIYLVWSRGIPVLYLGIIGLISGFFYSAPPLSLNDRGIGELLIGLNFGVLMVLGTYFVQAGSLSLEPVIASLPIALLVTAILYINEFPDYNADKQVGKDHLVVRLGKKRAATGYLWLISLVYISIIAGVVFSAVTPFALLGLLTLPLAIKAVKTTLINYDDTSNLIPANAMTILIHLLTGGLIGIGYILDKVILG